MSDILSVFVINLARSGDRYEHMQAQLAATGLAFQKIDAIDGRSLSARDRQRYRSQDRENRNDAGLTASEIGCFLSHRLAWETFYASGAPCALVLEDDVHLDRTLPSLLKDISRLSDLYDLVRVGGARRRIFVPLAGLSGGHRLVYLLGGPSGAYAYVISRTGAHKLLDNSEYISDQVDVFMDHYWKTKLRVLAVQPYPVTAHVSFAGASTIGDGRYEGDRAARQAETALNSGLRRARRIQRSSMKYIWGVRILVESVRLRAILFFRRRRQAPAGE